MTDEPHKTNEQVTIDRRPGDDLPIAVSVWQFRAGKFVEMEAFLEFLRHWQTASERAEKWKKRAQASKEALVKARNDAFRAESELRGIVSDLDDALERTLERKS